MTTPVIDIISQLKSTSSRNEKIAILEENKDIESLMNVTIEALEEKAKAEKWKELMMGVITSNEFNGHFQTIFEELSIQQLRDIMDLVEKEGIDGQEATCCIRIYGDMSASLYAEDFWKEGEHLLGHRDRLILGTNRLTGI